MDRTLICQTLALAWLALGGSACRPLQTGPDPELLAQLAAKDPVLRAEAVRELSEDPAAWTQGVVALLDDEHPRVRIAALEALPPQVLAAEDNLLARLRDPDIGVRLAAIAAAGRSQLPSARAELRKLTEAPGEAVRAAAVAALVQAGDRDTVRAASEDKAWQVRVEAARGLALWPNEQGARMARTLLSDFAPAVRVATVEAADTWPDELAVPLWLDALEPGARATRADRQAAGRLLAERWPPAAELSTAALLNALSTTHQEALAKLAELRSVWRQTHPRDDLAETLVKGATPAASSTSADLALVSACLAALTSGASADEQDRAVERLLTLDERLAPTLLAIAQDRPQLPERLYREALARRDPVHQDLAALEDPLPGKRRAAAIRLLHAARQTPLDDLALARLETLTLRTSDPLVWQTALEITGEDRREPALRLLLAAAGHPEGDLRETACLHLGDTRDARFAPALRAALDDPDTRVVAAAALALGRCGDASDVRLLESRLQSRLPEVRLAAAEGLAGLSKESGLAALERLSLDQRPTVRQRAVAAMGRIGEAELAAAVVARLDDEAAVKHAALESLRQIAPDAAAQIAPAGQGTMTADDEIAAWRAWAKRQAAPAALR